LPSSSASPPLVRTMTSACWPACRAATISPGAARVILTVFLLEGSGHLRDGAAQGDGHRHLQLGRMSCGHRD
jgi:hypothetical protein